MRNKRRTELVYWHANCAEHHVASLRSRSAAQASNQESSECTQDTSDAPTERLQAAGDPGTLNRRLPVC